MNDYLPEYPIVDINAVIYRYSTIKGTQDDLLVHIQNKDTEGTGYIFRETDDWSGLPSGTIHKYIPLANLPAYRFGEGSIETEGNGQVTGHMVIYNYRVDTAVANPDVDYIPDIEIPDVYNVLEDDAVSSTEARVEDLDEEEGEGTAQSKERRERALRAAKKAVGIGSTQAQLAMMAALTNVTFSQAYNVQMDGGVYKEDVALLDSKLPENKRGLRNGLAQQILHSKMVDSQYEEK